MVNVSILISAMFLCPLCSSNCSLWAGSSAVVGLLLEDVAPAVSSSEADILIVHATHITKSKENHLGHCFWPTYIKGRGPLLVLVYPCFRENVTVKCKIVSFLCTGSSDNFLLKNVIVFLLGNQVSKWHSFEIWGKKKVTFDHSKKFFSHQGEGTKKISTYLIHCTFMYFARPRPFDLFLPCQFCKNISYMAMRFELDTQKGWWRYIFHHVTLHF